MSFSHALGRGDRGPWTLDGSMGSHSSIRRSAGTLVVFGALLFAAVGDAAPGVVDDQGIQKQEERVVLAASDFVWDLDGWGVVGEDCKPLSHGPKMARGGDLGNETWCSAPTPLKIQRIPFLRVSMKFAPQNAFIKHISKGAANFICFGTQVLKSSLPCAGTSRLPRSLPGPKRRLTGGSFPSATVTSSTTGGPSHR